MLTLVVFPGFSPELWAEGAPEQDSCRVPHPRAHTKPHCPCAGGCGDVVTLLPFPRTITVIIIISVLYFRPPQSCLCLRMNELSLPFSARSNKSCFPSHPLTQLTFFHKNNGYKKKYASFSSPQTSREHSRLTTFEFPLFVQTKCFLSVTRLPHYRLLQEALCTFKIWFADQRVWAELNQLSGKLFEHTVQNWWASSEIPPKMIDQLQQKQSDMLVSMFGFVGSDYLL